MATTKQTYGDLQSKLDDVLVRLQSDDIDVDAALKLYEDGLKLTEQLETLLADAKNKVTELKKA